MDRVVHDRVHGRVRLSVAAAAVLESRFICRLGQVRQLGSCAHVYPSATHTRLEHAIGVAHLARKMGTHLARLYPDELEADDLVCLELAGLMHDIGHGPFSHLFEVYLKRQNVCWCHEQMGVRIVQWILADVLDQDHVRAQLSRSAAENVAAVCSMIAGADCGSAPRPERAFLFEIVNNGRCGVDVDKLDYLLRDSLAVFSSANVIDAARIIEAARICTVGKERALAFLASASEDIVDVFERRLWMHLRVYQHPLVLARDAQVIRHIEQSGADEMLRSISKLDLFAGMSDAAVDWWMDSATPHLDTCAACAVNDYAPLCGACRQPTTLGARYCAACGAHHASGKISICGVDKADLSARMEKQLHGCAPFSLVVANLELGFRRKESTAPCHPLDCVPFVSAYGGPQAATSPRVMSGSANRWQLLYCLTSRNSGREVADAFRACLPQARARCCLFSSSNSSLLI